MEKGDLHEIQSYIAAQIVPALKEELASEVSRLESKLNVSLAARHDAFEQEVRNEVNRHHSENRVRLQSIDEKAETNGLIAAEIRAKVDLMFGTSGTEGSMGRIETKIDRFQDSMTSLIGEVRGWAGERKGAHDAEDKSNKLRDSRMTAIKWIIGIGAPVAALFKWLQTHLWK
jgi:hypothetical protein